MLRVSAFPGIKQVNVELEDGFQKRDNSKDSLFNYLKHTHTEREYRYYFRGL